MALTQMTEEEFKLLSDLIYSYCGLTFTGSQKILFNKRVKTRVEKIRLSSFKEYYQFLKFDIKKEQEIKELVDILTVNETFFFRETAQFDILFDQILPEIEQVNKSKTVKIWSAACSTGAEPYTLAILLNEKNYYKNGWNIEIVGTDISMSALDEAKKAQYSEAAFRSTTPDIKNKYFTKTSDGLFQLDAGIISKVSFKYLNLLNDSQMKMYRNINIIFCRNVLIYFDNDAKQKVVENFYSSLTNNGYLLIGQSESLFKITKLYKLVPTAKVLLYKKD